VLAVIAGDRFKLLGEIVFSAGGSTPLKRSYPTLGAVRRLLEAHPEITKVRVSVVPQRVRGRSDSRTLADRRAKAVIAKLVRGGVESGRLASGGASSSPAAATKEGDPPAALVEFTIIARETDMSNEGLAPAR